MPTLKVELGKIVSQNSKLRGFVGAKIIGRIAK